MKNIVSFFLGFFIIFNSNISISANSIQLPALKGPYLVGYTSIDLSDPQRPETFTSDPNDKREIQLNIWYPANRDNNGLSNLYIDNNLVFLINNKGYNDFFSYSISTNSINNAFPAQKKFPVLFFSHDLGQIPQIYQSLIENIVSHGYVVAGINHAYLSGGVVLNDKLIKKDENFVNNSKNYDKILEIGGYDLNLAFNKLKEINLISSGNILSDKFDFNKTGCFGHAFGGDACLYFSIIEPSCKSVIKLDGNDEWANDNHKKIIADAMFMHSKYENSDNSIFSKINANGYEAMFKHAIPEIFTDYPFIASISAQKQLSEDDINKAIATNREVDSAILSFFNACLKDAPKFKITQWADRIKTDVILNINKNVAFENNLKWSWFGFYDDTNYPDVQHNDFGNLNILYSDNNYLQAWNAQTGTFWTTPDNYPKIFMTKSMEWVEYEHGSSNPVIFKSDKTNKVYKISETDPLKLFLDDYNQKTLDFWKIPGMAVAVIKDGKIYYTKGFGVLNTETQEKVDADSIFEIGSTTKAFTATSLGMLVDKGLLKWDAPVKNILPYFELNNADATQNVTIRHILSHQSGLGAYSGDALYFFFNNPDTVEIIKKAKYLPLVSRYGTKYAYNNLMYLAASQCIESLSGETWAEFIYNNIFLPTGMERSSGITSNYLANSNIAYPHILIDNKWQALDKEEIRQSEFDVIKGAGAIRSSIKDISQWLFFNLNNGLTYNNNILISPKNFNEIQTPQVLTDENSFYGFGWGIFKDKEHNITIIEHDGGTTGSNCRIGFIPEMNIALAVLTNAAPEGHLATHAAFNAIMGKLLNLPDEDYNKIFGELFEQQQILKIENWNALLTTKNTEIKPSLPMTDYIGKYQSHLYGKIEVVFNEGKIAFSMDGNIIGNLSHWKGNAFVFPELEDPKSDQPEDIFPIGFIIHNNKVRGFTIKGFSGAEKPDEDGIFEKY